MERECYFDKWEDLRIFVDALPPNSGFAVNFVGTLEAPLWVVLVRSESREDGHENGEV